MKYRKYRTFVYYQGVLTPLTIAVKRKGTSKQAVYYWRNKGLSLQEAFNKVTPHDI